MDTFTPPAATPLIDRYDRMEQATKDFFIKVSNVAI